MHELARTTGIRIVAAALIAAVAAFSFLAAAPSPATAAAEETSTETPAERRLDELVETGIRAGGPWFTPAERAVIERACGYAPGEWDGFQINMTGDTLTCTNGRRADSREVRAVLRAAEPRIEARVEAVMGSPEVRAVITEIALEAEADALREVARERRRRR